MNKKSSSDCAMPAEQVAAPNKDDPFSWVSVLGFVFLTYNTATAAYRSLNDPPALTFLLIAYFDLVGLFWCLREFERTNQRNKEKLKVAVWILATLLTTMFSYRVAAIMSWPLALVIWCLTFATTVGGFYAFFVYQEPLAKATSQVTQ